MLNPNLKKSLTALLGENVRFDEPMHRHTSFRVGGPAAAYATPASQRDLIELVGILGAFEQSYFVIGDGTNLLIDDKGIFKVVIDVKKCLNTILTSSHKDNYIRLDAMAGVKTREVCAKALKNGWAGMNYALGIPGTIGGAIMMNAGSAIGETSDCLESVKVLWSDGTMVTFSKDALDFKYRQLSFRQSDDSEELGAPIVLSGSFLLTQSDRQELIRSAAAILEKRKKNQPTQLPSAGCFFKNPDNSKTAGELIDLAGLKGKIVGGAQISPKHANFITNYNRARAADILSLMEIAQETVFRLFNVRLEPEVRIVRT